MWFAHLFFDQLPREYDFVAFRQARNTALSDLEKARSTARGLVALFIPSDSHRVCAIAARYKLANLLQAAECGVSDTGSKGEGRNTFYSMGWQRQCGWGLYSSGVNFWVLVQLLRIQPQTQKQKLAQHGFLDAART